MSSPENTLNVELKVEKRRKVNFDNLVVQIFYRINSFEGFC